MIDIKRLAIRQGDFRLDEVTFSVPAGRYAVLMGRTGSGKTSILEAMCGLRPIVEGTILIGDRNVAGLRAAERGIGYVPQDTALFTTMTVGKQLRFALDLRRWPAHQAVRRVEQLAELLEITHLLDRYPQGLSGGEAQRVALGRALSFQPQVLLLDEPLSALDEQTRGQMYQLLKRVQQHTAVTALHITHSSTEAQALADLTLLLADGKVVAAP